MRFIREFYNGITIDNYTVIRNIFTCDLAANSFLSARHGHNRPSSFPEEHSATSQHLIVSWKEGGGGRVLLVTQGRLFLPNGTNNGTQGRRQDRIIVSNISTRNRTLYCPY